MKMMQLFKRTPADSCEWLWPMLSAYADGEAPESEARRVESHISHCPGCASALSELNMTAASLRMTEAVDPPRYLTGAILAATTSLDASRRLRRPVLRIQWGFGAAAAAGVLAAVVFHANQQPMESPGLFSLQPRDIVREHPSAPSSSAAKSAMQSPPAVASNETGAKIQDSPDVADHSPEHASVQDALSEKVPPNEQPLFPSVGQRPPVSSRPFARVAVRTPRPSSGPNLVIPAPMTDSIPMIPMEEMVEPPMTKSDIPIMPIPMESPMAVAESKPPATAEPAVRTIVLTAESKALPAGQVASLADLKKSLAVQKWQIGKPEAFRGANGRVISLDIVKRSF